MFNVECAHRHPQIHTLTPTLTNTDTHTDPQTPTQTHKHRTCSAAETVIIFACDIYEKNMTAEATTIRCHQVIR